MEENILHHAPNDAVSQKVLKFMNETEKKREMRCLLDFFAENVFVTEFKRDYFNSSF